MAKEKFTTCKSCNAQVLKKAKVCPHCGVKNKKPFYKRVWFILLAVLIVFIVVVSVTGNDTEKLDWEGYELSYMLPEPDSKKGKLISDSEDYFSIEIRKTSVKEYKEYVDLCVRDGFDVEVQKTDSTYTAFNLKGYKLTVSYYESDETIRLTVDAPEKMTELDWPENGIGSRLPDPYEDNGKIVSDSEDYFAVLVADMTPEDLEYYIDECRDEGFINDYSKTETSYIAKDDDGYKVYITYTGFNTVEIKIEHTKETNNTTSDEPSNENKETPEGLRSDFKEAMDSYEAFMDEYVEFMKKYKESDGSDLSLLADYADYMAKYADFIEDFELWEDEELSDEELAYYIKVQARVNEKLTEVAY